MMNRRKLLRGSLLSACAAPTLAISAVADESPYRFPSVRWVKVWALMEDSHPSFPKYCNSLYDCVSLWVEFDRLTGAYEPVSPYDDIYRWPLANAFVGRDAEIPEDWQPEQWPRCLPLPPCDIQWEERAGFLYARQGAKQRWVIPRYVVVNITRDITEGLDGSRPRDRRDELRHHWKHCDLLTGEMVECAADDPLYDSPFAAEPVLT
ncbi:MAG: hypothetical protein ACX93N_08125 [Pseudohaliea sp.]